MKNMNNKLFDNQLGIIMDVREKLVELPIEDALLVLQEEHRQRTESYTTYLAHGGKGDPAEEVGLDALAMAISALEKTKWISVDDRLPEEDGGYLVVINYFGNHQSINVRSFAKAGETINEYDLAGEKKCGTATIANMDMFQLTLSHTGCHFPIRRKENDDAIDDRKMCL
jgi:hypothetical protein|nr:MAG TPA: Protein of unknown function (DUF551) [Herelleviridae sp.]